MSLDGGGKKVEGFDPGIYDELATMLDPDSHNANPDDIQYRAYHALLEHAKGNPTGHMLLLRFIVEKSRGWADKCASVNPDDSPEKLHGRTCYNAGVAYGMAAVAKLLNPANLARQLNAISERKRMRTNQFAVDS